MIVAALALWIAALGCLSGAVLGVCEIVYSPARTDPALHIRNGVIAANLLGASWYLAAGAHDAWIRALIGAS